MAGNQVTKLDAIADGLISICIPTYQRPALLAEALDSCLGQDYPSFEVVIGDDSVDSESERLVAEYERRHPGRIRYQHNVPSLRQNANVNDLFKRARGARLMLLHDDDRLLSGALGRLAKLWGEVPTLDAAFGKQILVEHDGKPVAAERTRALNDGYHRTTANAGLQPIPVVAGLRQMFPNDGYIVNAELARKIGYRSLKEVGDACDADFGIRLCAAARQVWYLDEFTVEYRITTLSIGKYALLSPYTYDLLDELKVSSEAEPILAEARREIAPGAVSGFTRLGRSKRAWQVYLSPDYSMRRRFTARGAYHFSLIVKSLFSVRKK